MSRQRNRHLQRQPREESIRLAITDLVGRAGTVDVQRMAYDWRADDVLIQIELRQPIGSTVLQIFRCEIASKVRDIILPDDPLQDWLVVIEYGGETVGRVASRDKLGEIADE